MALAKSNHKIHFYELTSSFDLKEVVKRILTKGVRTSEHVRSNR